jgi:phage baseplate assembly protein W
MAYNQPKSFLGTGWSFPPQFLDTTEGIKMSHDDEDIAESIYILLTTLPGERIMMPDFGCDLHSQVYKNINRTTLTTIEDMILTAIQKFEPRVDVDNIFIDTSQQIDGKLSINITYIIKGVNSRKNLVYPFYLIEGTDV